MVHSIRPARKLIPESDLQLNTDSTSRCLLLVAIPESFAQMPYRENYADENQLTGNTLVLVY